jgi:hypothetical protein
MDTTAPARTAGVASVDVTVAVRRSGPSVLAAPASAPVGLVSDRDPGGREGVVAPGEGRGAVTCGPRSWPC